MQEKNEIIFLDINGVISPEPFQDYCEIPTGKEFLTTIKESQLIPIPLTSGSAHRVKKEGLEDVTVLAELGSVLVNENGEKNIIKPFGQSGLRVLNLIRQHNLGTNILQIANRAIQNELLVCTTGFFSSDQDDRLSKISSGRQITIVTQNYFDETIQNESVAVILISDQKLIVANDINQKTKNEELWESLVYPKNVSKVNNAIEYLATQNTPAKSFFVDNQSHNLKPDTGNSNLIKIGILNTDLIEFLNTQISQIQSKLKQTRLLDRENLHTQLKDFESTLRQWQLNDNELTNMANSREILLFNSRQDFLDRSDDFKFKD